MARGFGQARPGVFVDADVSEGAYAVGVLRGVEKGLRTEAHQNAVVEATHQYFAAVFDNDYMKGVASTAKANFHHVYEYSAGGDDPYENIGNPMFQLWEHWMQRPRGGAAVATWRWKPATQPVPSYTQRRMSAVGQDEIRNFSQEAFEELIEKSNGRRHVYVWKSVMLEYGIVANIVPQDSNGWLMVPMFGGKKRFAKQHIQGQQAPGETLGRFTSAWVNFWGGRVVSEWDQTVGRFIAKDAEKRINAALTSGKGKPRKENRTFALQVFGTNATSRAGKKAHFERVFAAGRAQGEAAIKANELSMRRISQATGWSNPLGYADD